MDEPASYCAPETLVEAYIRRVRANVTEVGLRFRDREKTLEALRHFGITHGYVTEAVMGLHVSNYSHCREPEPQTPEAAWVFGIAQFDEEIYLKLKSKQMANGKEFTICVSYHVAEYPLVYPYADRRLDRQRGA